MIPGSANPLLLATAAAAGGYEIERSLRFNSSDSAYLGATFGTPTDQDVFTLSMWAKRSALGSTQHLFGVSTNHSFGFTSGDALNLTFGGSSALTTTALFRDPSAWYHIMWVQNGTAHTLYVNGASVGTATATSSTFNTAVAHQIGAGNTANFFNGYLADIHFIDGQALGPSSFGEFDTNGVWQPIAYTGSYGTNGFHLPFSDNSTAAALGTDTSGNGNDWTPNNLSNLTGGPTSVAAASGALPLYNTTDTYGTVKGTGTRTDSNSSSIVLAVPMDGTNNGTTFTDESATIKGSGSAKTVTAFGNAKTITAESKYCGSSADFAADGTDYLEVPHSSDLDLNSATNWTVEAWVYVDTNRTYNYFVSKGRSTTREWAIATTSTTVRFYWSTNGSSSGDSVIAISHVVPLGKWNHIAVVKSSSTITIYVNGVAIGSGSFTSGYSGTLPLYVGRFADYTGISHSLDGKINDLRIYNGVAKYTSNFNPPSSTQNATVAAGNDSLVDSPTNGSQEDTGAGGEVRGNYATLNPLSKGSAVTLSDGNLQHYSTDSTWSGPSVALCGFGMTSGKWYWECTISTGAYSYIGMAQIGKTHSYIGANTNSCGYLTSNGVFYGGGAQAANPAVPYTANATLMFAYDADAKKFWVGQNGTWFSIGGNAGDPANGNYPSHSGFGSSGEVYTPATSTYGTVTTRYNFGQRPFAYTAPSGFEALCTTNLAEPTIADGSTAMDVVLDTGANILSAAQGAIGGSADLLWIKGRTNNNSHQLIDTVRGGTTTLRSNTTAAETTYSAPSSGSSVAWIWDAGSSTVTNTQGSITSQVRANASAGFSIVTYTGTGANATVGHGLNLAPSLVIVKCRSAASNWAVYHSANTAAPATDYLLLNSIAATADDNTYWNDTAPTSTVFSIGTNANVNTSSATYVAYCWAGLDGYSSFGSYIGNGSTDGPFVYTGFRPRWLFIKRSDSSTGANWRIWDTARDQSNRAGLHLLVDTANGEYIDGYIDILSNGFKMRETYSGRNASGGTYIYAAFSEVAFNFARGR